jgi:hypothetical protein
MIIIIPLIILVFILAWVLRPGKKPTRSRLMAILVTVVLPLIVALVSIIIQLLNNTTGTVEVSELSNTLFVTGLGLIGIAILVAVVSTFLHKGEIARGTGFGVCIDIIISIIELGLLEWLGGV